MSGQIGFSLSNDDNARDDIFSEGSGGSITRSIGIYRTGDLSVAASVNWTVSGLVLGGMTLGGWDLTANGGVTSANAEDFVGGTLPKGVITFAPGQEFQTISLEILGDSTPEWNEGYSVTLSSPTEGYALADYIHNAAIEDDDRPYVWIPQQYTVTHPEGDLGHTNYIFPVYRSGGMSEVTIFWTITDSVSTNGFPADYNDFNYFYENGGIRQPFGYVTFAEGQTEQSFTVEVAGDGTPEPDETILVQVYRGEPRQISDVYSGQWGLIVIENDDEEGDPSGQVQFSLGGDNALLEGDDGTTAFSFTIYREGDDLSGTHSVNWSVQGRSGYNGWASAADAADFEDGVFPSGTVTFGPDETEQTITIYVRGDHDPEGNGDPDVFAVLLSDPSDGAFATDSPVHGIIQDDDLNHAYVRFNPMGASYHSIVEGQSGSTPVSFSILRATADSNETMVVNWKVYGPHWFDYPYVDGADFLGGKSDSEGGTRPSGSVTFAPGEDVKVITLHIAGDTQIEPDEEILVQISSGDPGTKVDLFVSYDSLYIISDDSELSIEPTASSFTEGNAGSSELSFWVQRYGSESATGSISVNWTISGDVNAADFLGGVLPSGTLTFASGESEKFITLNIAGDTLFEDDETVTVTLSNPSAGAAISTHSASTIILNDDDGANLVTLELCGCDQWELEGDDGTIAYTFTIYRDGDDLSGTHSVTWSVTGFTGWYGDDVPADAADFEGGVLPTETVTFDPFETEKTITILVRGDHDAEGESYGEAFTVQLSNPTNGAIASDIQSSGFIEDDDWSFVSVAFDSENQVTEGHLGATLLSFTIYRDGWDLGETATVNWEVLGDGASPADGADFVGGVLPSGSVTFAPGEFEKIVTLQIAGDSAIESDEDFIVQISPGDPGTLLDEYGASFDWATILTDDSMLDIEALTASLTEGNAGSTELGFRVQRSGSEFALGTISVNWTISGDVNAADFLGGVVPSGTLTFASGETEKFITLNIAGDTLFESDETVTVTLSNPSAGAAISMASASTIILNDDDGAGLVTLELCGCDQWGLEGDDGTIAYTFTIYRDGDDLSGTHSVTWSVTGFTGWYGDDVPADAADFEGGVLPTETVTFDPFETEKTITILVRGDHDAEGESYGEAFTVQLSNPTNGAIASDIQSSGFIEDDDWSFVSVAFDSENQVTEGHLGATLLSFTIYRDGWDLGETATVNWEVLGDGASPADGADFVGGVLPSGSVTFAPGEFEKIVTLQIAGDSAIESDEDFIVQISPGDPGTLLDEYGASFDWATILTDDSMLDIEALTASLTEGNAGSTELGFRVQRSGSEFALGTISVNWTISGDVNAADFLGGVVPSGTLTFASGETEKFITLNIAGDTLFESDETVTVTLSNPSAGATIGTASASAIILNDDAAPPYPGISFTDLTEAADTVTYERGASAVAVRGLGANDNITGSRFADILLGNAGNDLLKGGNGADTIEGGAGSDRVQGGAGNDVFVFRKADFAEAGTLDHIVDFQGAGGAPTSGNDLLEFHGFAAGSTLTFHRLADSHRNGALYKVTDAGDGSVTQLLLQFADGNYTGTTQLAAGDFVFIS